MESSAGLQGGQRHLYLPKYSDKVCRSPAEDHVSVGGLFQEGMRPFQGQRQGGGWGVGGANLMIARISFYPCQSPFFIPKFLLHRYTVLQLEVYKIEKREKSVMAQLL